MQHIIDARDTRIKRQRLYRERIQRGEYDPGVVFKSFPLDLQKQIVETYRPQGKSDVVIDVLSKEVGWILDLDDETTQSVRLVCKKWKQAVTTAGQQVSGARCRMYYWMPILQQIRKEIETWPGVLSVEPELFTTDGIFPYSRQVAFFGIFESGRNLGHEITSYVPVATFDIATGALLSNKRGRNIPQCLQLSSEEEHHLSIPAHMHMVCCFREKNADPASDEHNQRMLRLSLKSNKRKARERSTGSVFYLLQQNSYHSADAVPLAAKKLKRVNDQMHTFMCFYN
jgi:hypothetical protein